MAEDNEQETPKTLTVRAQEKQAVWAAIANMDGEVDGFVETWLAEVEKNLATKVDSYKFFSDEIEMEEARLKIEANKLAAAAKTLNNLRESLKERIKFVMKTMEVKELSGSLWRYQLSDTAPSLLIDEKLLPPEFMITEQIPATTKTYPDAERIKALLGLGEAIAGCELKGGKALKTYVVKKGKK